MFRNLRFYTFTIDWPSSEEQLSDLLEQAAFTPCGPLTDRSSGWEAVFPDSSDLLARRLASADLVKLRSQSRILPAAAVDEALQARVEEFIDRMGEAPTAREKRRLKAETRDELLPKAMLKSDRVWGYIDLKLKVIAVGTAQEAMAERFLRRLSAAFGALDVRPLGYNTSVVDLLTRVFLGSAPSQFVVGRECRMQDLRDPASIVRWSNFDLSDRSIRDHVADGMRLTHLAIDYDNVLNCVVDEHGTLTKIKLVGSDVEADTSDDPQARHDAEFALVSGTVRNLLQDFSKLLGGFASPTSG
ncbi:MAG: recombination-associated protein RdgC [Pseudomonadota bacterium]